MIRVGPVESHESLKSETLSQLWSEKEEAVEQGQRCSVAGFEGGEGGHEPRNRATARSRKGEE